MASISLCMIVKNEEKTIDRCLSSICELVDEIIIADTGSEDSTVKIAEKYTDKIYYFPWIDDFSAARNFSFSKATQDYIMWMDADDVFSSKGKNSFIELKNRDFESADAVFMPYHTSFDEEGHPICTYYRERIVKREKNFIWKGRVHESMQITSDTIYLDSPVLHKSVKTSYSDRNLKIYEKQISSGEPISSRDIFYYGRELYYNEKYNEAVLCLLRFIDKNDGWLENKIEACKILSFCYKAVGDSSASISSLFKSFTFDTPRAEICCEIGSIFLSERKYALSIFWYKTALTIPMNEKSGAFISRDCYGYIPYIQLCVCYYYLGDIKKSKECNDMAGLYRPESPAYKSNLLFFKSLDTEI